MVAVNLTVTQRKKMRIIEVNYEKLKKIRKTRKLTLREVEEILKIPAPTIQKYETGRTKRVAIEVLKKLCDIYGTDYYMYFWWTKFTSLSDIILHFIYFPEEFSEDRKLFEILDITEYFDFDTKAGTYISLYNKLTKEERKDYQRFKVIVVNTLKIDENFLNVEFEEEEKVLFSLFYANKIKREKQVNLKVLKEDKLKKV